MCLQSLIPVGIFELPLCKHLHASGVHLLLGLLHLSQSSIDLSYVFHIDVMPGHVVDGAAVVLGSICEDDGVAKLGEMYQSTVGLC